MSKRTYVQTYELVITEILFQSLEAIVGIHQELKRLLSVGPKVLGGVIADTGSLTSQKVEREKRTILVSLGRRLEHLDQKRIHFVQDDSLVKY